jgi:hypothetical protein
MCKYLQLITVELSKELCEIAIAQDDRSLSALQDIYWYYCPKIQTDGVCKVRLVFERAGTGVQRIEQLVDVVTSFEQLDPDALFRRTGIERRRAVTDFIYSALAPVCLYFGWDQSPCEVARDKLIENGFKASEMWKKPIRAKGRNISAQVWWTYEEEIRLGLEISGECKHRVVLTVLGSGIGALWEQLGRLSWINDRTLQLVLKNERDSWTYDVLDDKVEFIYGPAQRGDPKGEYDLAMMYLYGRIVQRDRAAAIHWLSLSAAHGFERAKRRLAAVEQGDFG